MWLKWFPWTLVIRWLARSHGFLDPVAILSHLRRFAQPSEVVIPIELLRNCFLHEETSPRRLVMGAGIFPEWLSAGGTISIGPAPTSWGPVHLSLDVSGGTIHVRWQAHWFRERPVVEIRLPGREPVVVTDDRGEVSLGG